MWWDQGPLLPQKPAAEAPEEPEATDEPPSSSSQARRRASVIGNLSLNMTSLLPRRNSVGSTPPPPTKIQDLDGPARTNPAFGHTTDPGKVRPHTDRTRQTRGMTFASDDRAMQELRDVKSTKSWGSGPLQKGGFTSHRHMALATADRRRSTGDIDESVDSWMKRVSTTEANGQAVVISEVTRANQIRTRI